MSTPYTAPGGPNKPPSAEFDYDAPHDAESDGDIPLGYHRHTCPLRVLRPSEPPAPNSFLLRPPLIGRRYWTLHLANGEIIVTDFLTLRDERAVRKQCHWDALQIFPRQNAGEWRRELVATDYFELAGGPEREHILVKKGVLPVIDLRHGGACSERRCRSRERRARLWAHGGFKSSALGLGECRAHGRCRPARR
jgi:hypothetical protein